MEFFSARDRSAAAEDEIEFVPYEHQEIDETLDFAPGERIGKPPNQGASMGSALLVVISLMLSGWAAMASHEIWAPWLSSARKVFTTEAPATTLANASGAHPEQPVGAPEAPLVEKVIANAPGHEAGEAVANITPEKNGHDASPAGEERTESFKENQTEPTEATAPEPLAPPVVNADDRLGKRALQVGLHPDLSRSLLQKMTAADFRNAEIAIHKALASGPVPEVFIWPKKTTAKRAQFEVHFVAAATPECRRYIVTINKDRWATTAQPMEKCGRDIPKRGGTIEANG